MVGEGWRGVERVRGEGGRRWGDGVGDRWGVMGLCWGGKVSYSDGISLFFRISRFVRLWAGQERLYFSFLVVCMC